MSNTGKGKCGRGKGKSVSKLDKTGILFPVGRIARFLRKGKFSHRLSAGAPVYIAAVLEYLTREILELSGNAAKDNGKRRITPNHIQLAIKVDDELNDWLKDTIIPGGAIIHVFRFLIPPKRKEE